MSARDRLGILISIALAIAVSLQRERAVSFEKTAVR